MHKRAVALTIYTMPSLQTFRPLIRSAIAIRQPHTRLFTTTATRMSVSKLGTQDHPIATLDTSLIPRLPASSPTLFDAKKKKNITFEAIGKELGRDEVAVAALFYGQAQANTQDVERLAKLLDIDHKLLSEQLYQWPDRGRTLDLPPKDPLIYRLFEVVQNYGYAYKAILNEKFGDGIMSAITFSTKVEKETDEKGDWVKITWRGKWLPYSRF